MLVARCVLLQLLILLSLSSCCWQHQRARCLLAASFMLASRRDFAAAHADSRRRRAIASPVAEGAGVKARVGLARRWARLAARLKETLPREGGLFSGSLLTDLPRGVLQCGESS